MMRTKYGCVMLAGGRGKRMGCRNKAEIEYGGSTFGSRIASELTGTGMPCYLSAAEYEQKMPDGWTPVTDEVTGPNGEFVGPMGGIYSCLRKAKEDGLSGLFFAPCDAPFYEASIIEKLLGYLDGEGNGSEDGGEGSNAAPDVVIWKTGDGRMQPLFGWYSVSCIPAFEEDIRNGGFKLIKSIESVDHRILETGPLGVDDRSFININSMEDYRNMLKKELWEENLTEPISLEEGIERLVSKIEPISEKETVALRETTGRILAEDILATRDQPPFARSPVDGYAIRSVDSAGASKEEPVTLKVIGEVDAGGEFSGSVGEGEALRIMTGGPIPDGADAVIMQESTDYGEDAVSIYKELSHDQNICEQGEDYRKGEALLTDRTYIGAVETGIIASTGRTEAAVYRRPRAVVISTGDEVAAPGEALKPSQIYDSNRFTMEAILTGWGVEIAESVHIADDPKQVVDVIDKFADSADMFISTGGVSVGKKDIMHEVYTLLDVDKAFWRLNIKPGSAMMAGQYKGKPLLSLSGNPYAAYVDMHLVVRQVVAAMKANEHLSFVTSHATLMSGYGKKSPTRRFVRAYVQDGKAEIEGHIGGNGVIAPGRGTNALIEIPEGSGALSEGEEVKVLFL